MRWTKEAAEEGRGGLGVGVEHTAVAIEGAEGGICVALAEFKFLGGEDAEAVLGAFARSAARVGELIQVDICCRM